MKSKANEIHKLEKYQSLKIKPEKKEKINLVEELKKYMYIYNYVPFFEEIEENMSIKKGLNQRYKKDT